MALRNWRVQFTATLACIVLAFALGDRLVVDKPPSIDEVRPKVVIRGKEFFVPEHYPKDASGKLQYDKKLIEELDMKTMDVLHNMCKHNPPSAPPTYKDKKANLIYKRVFCDFIYNTRVCTSYIYGRFYGGGGVIPTQSGRFFSSRRFSQKCRSVAGGMLYLFEISKKWLFRKGMGWGGGGGRWPYFFVPDPKFLAFWCLLQKSGLVWFGLYTGFHGAWPGAPTCRQYGKFQ